MLRTTLMGQGAVTVGDPDLLVGLTDLEIGFVDGAPVLYAAGRGGSTLSRFALGNGDDPASLQDSWTIPTQFLQLEDTEIALVTGPGGTTNVLLAGLSDDDLQGQVETGSGLNGSVTFDAGGFDLGQISAIAMSGDGTSAMITLRGGGLAQLEFGSNGQVSVSVPTGLGELAGQTANAVSWVTVNSIDYAVVTYAGSDQIALLRAGGNGQFAHVDTASPEDGAWVDSPSAVVTLTGPDGMAYVIMAASGSSSLTVLVIEGNTLVPVDHMIDTLDTRFDDVSHLSVMEIAGQPYVVAAGSDQGLTVFTLLPGGQLLEVATLAASLETPLNGISAIEVVVTGDMARIFVAMQGPPYLVEFSFDLENAGVTQTGDAGADIFSGTAGDDVISGGAGADTLSGGVGNDVITDGAGLDLLSGDAGADTFIFAEDGAVDRILDFQRGIDTILLTAPLPGLGVEDILLISRSWGAEIRIGTEVLHVYTADGSPLTWADFEDGGLGLNPNISTDLDDYIDDSPDTGPETGGDLDPTLFYPKPSFEVQMRPEPVIVATGGNAQMGSPQNDNLIGGSSTDEIVGQGGNDLIEGNGNNDVLIGAGGFDTILGGVGDDTISGGNNADFLEGGTGHDVITGGDGFDVIYGGVGDDQIWGGGSPDRIFGGDGDDWISAGFSFGFTVDGVEGGAGNDTILGEQGFDLLIGGSGDDVIDGGHQADNLFGDEGNDTLYGNLGFDRLFGGDGDDLLYGGEGPDSHFGQGGNDQMWGGTGDDRFFGGSGNDYIVGEEGDDILGGNSGFDTLIGGAGDDILYGDFNADRFVFADGHGHDRVIGFDANNILEVLDISGLSTFYVTSDVLAQTEQVGLDVVITTGVDSSITLVGVDLADLDGTDFLF
ncbi:calcium-binding protein [Roseovarius sp. 2305UL8-3]|uniref:calcium-binding protein n=1 Tax=Roseovarius conchicola TaxID=3121636 RepID=UPI0035271398